MFDLRAAAVNSHIDFNENVGLTALWFRPYNDNYDSSNQEYNYNDPSNYLDNMDLFSLMLPMRFNRVELTPWVMYGMQGRNTGNFSTYRNSGFVDGAPAVTLTPYLNALGNGGGLNVTNLGHTSKDYGSMVRGGQDRGQVRPHRG